ncbi:formyltransferase family protein [Teredinibacter turnerae]|uniref:formyltransferase family protein n=1 Tax=Teredinibacter turnerae TaxID=2426 RepID=UPI000371E6F5|nr:formyltransferase family protein [Teredinibacter turnerae]
MSDKSTKPLVVFTASSLALPLLSQLQKNGQLATVILPALDNSSPFAHEVFNLRARLHEKDIPYLNCGQAQLSELAHDLDRMQVEVGVIFTYPHVLPEKLLAYFAHGVFNLHGSRLPAYPGPCPLYWQIRNREPVLTLTLHKATNEPDQGDIVAARDIPIHPLDTLQSLSNQMAWLALPLIAELQRGLGGPELTCQPQFAADKNWESIPGKNYARRPRASDLQIIWQNMSAEAISAMCRAGAGQPFSALFYYNNCPLLLQQATPVDYPQFGIAAGTILFIGEPEGLIVATRENAVRLDIISCADGLFTGYAFAERFSLDAGIQLKS